jgi:very-short-patch-repair endonuclease
MRLGDRRTSRELTQRAKEMRREKTPAEDLLWQHLRSKRLTASRWRQQYPVGGYIADFYCARSKLVIELDGAHHAWPEYLVSDQVRTEYLQARGLQLLRFANADVMTDTALVLDTIEANLA